MPLMSAIVCGLAVDEERAAGRLANLTAVPSRGRAVAAKLLALAALGAAALAVALGVEFLKWKINSRPEDKPAAATNERKDDNGRE